MTCENMCSPTGFCPKRGHLFDAYLSECITFMAYKSSLYSVYLTTRLSVLAIVKLSIFDFYPRSVSAAIRFCHLKSFRVQAALLVCILVIIVLHMKTAIKHNGKIEVRHEGHKTVEKIESKAIKPETKKPAVKKLLLMYSTFFNGPIWNYWNDFVLRKEFSDCPGSKNCVGTHNKSRLLEADALLFNGRDVEMHRNDRYSASALKDLRRASGKHHQKWIYFAHETPQWDRNIYKPYDGVFNWTATYNRNSDVFAPYAEHLRINPPEPVTTNFAKKKKYLVAWPVSNCNPKVRLEYALELQKYIPLTVYGGCGRFFKDHGDCTRKRNDCLEKLSLYKFILSFENEFCHDWMTEKYWRVIKVESVPVVMGENFEGLAIPNSYIDVNKFGSIKALADYLLYLDKNDEEYNKFFAYKGTYKGSGIAFFYCSICDKLNSEAFEKRTEVTLSERYGFKETCHQDPKRITDLERQIQESKMVRNNTR